jgi:hypothetical protein
MTLLWNQRVQTNADIVANRSIIKITHKKDQIFILVDVTIPSDTNVIQKESEKKSEHENCSVFLPFLYNI